MKAISFTQYGSPDVLKLKEIQKPTPNDNEVLVKVHATTVNRTDCAAVRAIPFFMRLATGVFKPKKQIPGTEFAGVVEAVGYNISSLKVGDRVFGFDDSGLGSHAEYLTVGEDRAVIIPGSISFKQAAASFEGAHYAINFINKVNLKEGQSVLVNGATGAIGSAAVQLLRNMGVYITAVCDTRNVDLVRSLGANRVIDYTKDDFTKDEKKYSFVFDAVGKSSFFRCISLLKQGGVYISSDLGFMAQNLFLPLITSIINPILGHKKTIFPMPKDIRRSLKLVKELIEQGKFTAVIDREFPLEQIVAAFKYVEKGHKIGNVVIIVEH